MTFFPTNHYPGIYWPTSRQVEAALPVTAAPPFFDQLTADNIAASGIRETIVLRSEERRQLTFFGLDALETAQWGQYFTERGGRGQQAELLVDRFTGRAFTFANTVADQNSEPVSAYLATPSYQITYGKIGLVAPASTSAIMFAENAGSANAAVVSSAGTVVMTVVCSFAGNDSIRHQFWRFDQSNNQSALYVDKTAANQVQIECFADGGATVSTAIISGTADWPSGAIVTLLGKWTMGQSFGIQMVVSGSPLREATASLSGVTLTFSGPRVGVVGAGGIAGSFPLTRAVILAFATYKKAYADPTVLASHFPLGRNYYSKAELVERTFNPTRISPGVDAWQWTWTFRQGF